MKTLYLDIFSGISGDMFLGALLDLGVDFTALQKELGKLRVDGYHLHCARAERQQIEGVKFDVHVGGHHGHGHAAHEGHHHEHEHDEHAHGRNFAEIKQLIADSGLSPWVKEKAVAVFQRIAVAEGKIHGKTPDEVHFHEVGAVDSIVDIVGGCIGLEMLQRPRVLAGCPVDGVGWIDCAHGRFPIPAPATLEIFAARSVSVSQCEEPHELITPTGAALLAEFAEEFGPMKNLRPERIGIGVGGRSNKTRPNVLRAVLGESEGSAAHDWEIDTIAVLETNLDDITAEWLGHFTEKAMAAGALDVFHTPIQMKKNRPGVLLTVLCEAAKADDFSEMMLRETTAFGIRRTVAERRKLRREFKTVSTPYGSITVKIGQLDGQTLQIAPEYESCKKAAAEKQAPLKDVYEAARRAASAGPP
ncbi:MAG TPA: nickel pincer cofactor biosynthesis protein LarC [Verrucomicrobiae bacterium]|jgi:hypothetical protein|nr:nickel pincer cofactor biosynthesis protein LarC [Verrucomicrobiae bacterium]